MTGFYYFIKYMVTGISPQFGEGFAIGAWVAWALFYLVYKISPERFHGHKNYRGY